MVGDDALRDGNSIFGYIIQQGRWRERRRYLPSSLPFKVDLIVVHDPNCDTPESENRHTDGGPEEDICVVYDQHDQDVTPCRLDEVEQ